jgi:hypothetical protein
MQINFKKWIFLGRKQKVCIHQGTMMKRKVAYNLVTRWWNEFIKKNFKPQIVENVLSFNTNLWQHKDKQIITTSKRVKTTMAKNDYKQWEKNTMQIKFKNFKENLMKNWGGDACQELNSIAIMMKK